MAFKNRLTTSMAFNGLESFSKKDFQFTKTLGLSFWSLSIFEQTHTQEEYST